MPSRVRVAALIGGRAYFGRHALSCLRNVADGAGVLVSNRKKGTTWQDILAAWEVVARYIDGYKLYVVRERRGADPSRSLFNQKLLGYKRNKKKKVAKLPAWAWDRAPVGDQVVGRVEEAAPPLEQPAVPRDARPARQEIQYADWQGHIIRLNRD